MADVSALMDSAKKLRDALYDRLDDNISDRAFELLRFRHAQAVMEVRRTDLPAQSAKYDSVIDRLDQATGRVNASSTSDDELLPALAAAGDALDRMIQLP